MFVFTRWLKSKKVQKAQSESKPKKMFVLDTNILMYGIDYLATIPAASEVEIFIPWAVVEEVIGFRRRSFRDNSGFSRDFIRSIRRVWSVMSAKIENGEWKLVGSEGRSFKEIFQKNGFAIGVNDSRIIAAAGILKERFAAVFLVSRDRTLREIAAELGISVLCSLDEFREELFKK